VLFNPEGTVERVKQIEAEDGGDKEGLNRERALTQSEEISTGVQAKANRFEEREQELGSRLGN
jgi:hypothetical protein